MKILVAVKRVIDFNVQVRVKSDGTGVETENIKMSMNPPDENAVEEALRIKESGKASEVIVVSIGEDKAHRVVDFVGDAGGQLADGSHFLRLQELGFEHFVAGKV